MNVLQTLQAVCYEGNLPAPPNSVTLSTTTEPQWLQLIYLYYAVGRELRQLKYWPQLKKTNTFNTVSSQAAYALPADFYASIPDTFYNVTNKNGVAAPVSDATWNSLAYWYSGNVGITNYYRIFGQPVSGNMRIFVSPTPTSVMTLSYDYIIKNWIYDTATAGEYETIQQNTDTCYFDDDLMILGLKAKYYKHKGQEYESFEAEFKQRVAQAQARFQGARRGSLIPYDGSYYFNVPEGGYGL